MAIIVEDGTIVAGANAYASLNELDTYHEDRGNTAWVNADDETKEAAMLRATAGLETQYRERWIGFKSNHNDANAPQFLAWPRKADSAETTAEGYTVSTMTKLVDYDGIEIAVNVIPQILKQAYMEVCLVEITEPFVSVRLGRDDMLKYQRVDVIEQEWLRNAPAVTTFPHINMMLQGLASTAPVMLGASIGLTEGEQDMIKDQSAFDEWFKSLMVI